MNITETISLLDELRGQASEDWWIDGNTVFSDCDCDAHGGTDIAFSGNIEDVTYAFNVANAYQTLRQAALDGERYRRAGEELADAISKNGCCHVTREYCECMQRRDNALTAYRTACEK